MLVKMLRISNVCSLLQSDEESQDVIVIDDNGEVEEGQSLLEESSPIEIRDDDDDDDALDLCMEVEEEENVHNIEISDSELSDECQEAMGCSQVDSPNVTQLLKPAIATTDGIFQFNHAQSPSAEHQACINETLKHGPVAEVRTGLIMKADNDIPVATSDSEMNKNCHTFGEQNQAGNEDLKQVLVATLAKGIIEDISQFHYEQQSLLDSQCSSVKHAHQDKSLDCSPAENAQASLCQLTNVKSEGSSIPISNIKIETEFPDTESSPKTETLMTSPLDRQSATLTSYLEHQPCDKSTSQDSTVYNEELERDYDELRTKQIVRNGLQYQRVISSCQTSGLLDTKTNLLSCAAPHPVFVVKSLAATDASIKEVTDVELPKSPGREVHDEPSIKINLLSRCLVCNVPFQIEENRKTSSLPFCIKCKRKYFYQLANRQVRHSNACRHGDICKIDYRQSRNCTSCHYNKFAAVLAIARKAFKEPVRFKATGHYSPSKASKQKQPDWSIVRDQILLQEAIICQPRVLLRRVDTDIRFTHLLPISCAESDQKRPCHLMNPDREATFECPPDSEIIRTLLSRPPLSLSVGCETSYSSMQKCKYPVVGKKLTKISGVPGINSPQRNSSTSTIDRRIIKLAKINRSKMAKTSMACVSLCGQDFQTGSPRKKVFSVATPRKLSQNVRQTNQPAAVGGIAQDVLSMFEAGKSVASNRLVSHCRGKKRKPRKRDTCVSRACCCGHQASEKIRRGPVKVSIFICGHACSECNSSQSCKWLKDHGYAKKYPLDTKSSKCKKIQELVTEGTSSKAHLILNKLRELNELLQENSNSLLEVKERATPQVTKPSTASENSLASAVQHVLAVMLNQNPKPQIPLEITNTLNHVLLVPTVNEREQSSRLLQKCDKNQTEASQSDVGSFPHSLTNLVKPQLPSTATDSQIQQPDVATKDVNSYQTPYSSKIPNLSESSKIPNLSESSTVALSASSPLSVVSPVLSTISSNSPNQPFLFPLSPVICSNRLAWLLPAVPPS